MTERHVTDTTLEWVLRRRAGDGAPVDLRGSILAALETAGPRSSSLGPGSFGRSTPWRLLAVAAVSVAAVGGALLLASQPRNVAPTPTALAVVPSPSAGQSQIADASPTPGPTLTPSSTPDATANPAPAGVPANAGEGVLSVDGDIFVTDANGGHLVRIADGHPITYPDPDPGSWGGAAWSADGRYVSAYRGDTNVLLRPDGTRVRTLPFGAGIWSPIGETLALLNGQTLSTYDVPTKHTWSVTLPSTATFYDDPAWSPDGRRLLIGVCSPCSQDEGPVAYWIWTVGTSGHEVLTLPQDRRPAHPFWSPDGTTIAYWRQICPSGPPCVYDVDVVPAAGGKAVTLTSDDATLWPIWAPDSRHLALEHGRSAADMAVDGGGSGDTALLSMTLDPTHQEVVSTSALTPFESGFGEFPLSWTPDGAWVYYIRAATTPADQPGPMALWVVRADGTSAHQLAAGQDLSWSLVAAP